MILGYHIGVYEDDVVCTVMSCTLIAVTDVSGKPVPFVRLDWTSEHFYQTAVGRRGTFELRKNCPISTTNRMWIAL